MRGSGEGRVERGQQDRGSREGIPARSRTPGCHGGAATSRVYVPEVEERRSRWCDEGAPDDGDRSGPTHGGLHGAGWRCGSRTRRETNLTPRSPINSSKGTTRSMDGGKTGKKTVLNTFHPDKIWSPLSESSNPLNGFRSVSQSVWTDWDSQRQ